MTIVEEQGIRCLTQWTYLAMRVDIVAFLYVLENIVVVGRHSFLLQFVVTPLGTYLCRCCDEDLQLGIGEDDRANVAPVHHNTTSLTHLLLLGYHRLSHERQGCDGADMTGHLQRTDELLDTFPIEMELAGCKDAVLMGRTFGEGLIGALREIAGDHASDDLDNVFRQLGTVVYLMDAIDDLDEDFKEGTYNPLLPEEGFVNSADFRLKNVYSLTSMLNEEIGSLQGSYSKVRPQLRAGQGICDNIVFLGIPDSAKKVMMGSSSAKTSVTNVLSNRKQRMSEGT